MPDVKTCFSDILRVQYPKTEYEKSPSDQAAAVLLHLVKKGSLTKCKTTGRLEVNGNSKSKVVKK